MTHRQFMAWQEWLEGEWNRPSRTDHYLMQIAFDVRRANVKHPERVKFDHMRLEFGEPKPPAVTTQSIALSKQSWLQRVMQSPNPMKPQTWIVEGD